MLSKEQHRKRVRKGVNDGQYYHDQPISQPRRRSGADSQPQMGVRARTSLTGFVSQPSEQRDVYPSALGNSYAVPGRDTFEDKDVIHCPLCAQPTLTVINSLEPLPEDIRCTACGARFRTDELLEARFAEEISNVLMANNVSSPVIRSASQDFVKSDSLTVKEYLGFDIDKSVSYATNYVRTLGYKRLLKSFFSDLTAVQRRSLGLILQRGFFEGRTIREVGVEIARLIGDEQRAQLIARTELVRIGNEGNLMRMEDKGVKKVEFVSAPEDGRLCSHCKKLDRKVFKLVDAKGLIPLHPRCRCTLSEYYD